MDEAMTKTTELDVLQGARELLADEAKWTKGVMARREDGVQVSAEDPRATCFCAFGAISKVAPQAPYATAFDIRCRADKALYAVLPEGFSSVEDFNDADETTHADVLALFDRAVRFVATGEKSP